MVLVAAFWKIYSDLKKLRVQMSQQLNRDLLSKRVTAYGELWSRMKPTAIYITSPFGANETEAYLKNLSEWYFLENGGLFLTSRARDFYFALQDLLRSVGRLPPWYCMERPSKPEKIFQQLLKDLAKQDKDLKEDLEVVVDNLEKKKPEEIDSTKWSAVCESVFKRLETLVNTKAPKA